MTIHSVIETEHFANWLGNLKVRTARSRLQLRLRKVTLGNLGDHKPVGDGVWEMREFFGPGWRRYYILQGSTVIMMLGGGEKSNQSKDLEKAKALAKELHNEQDQDPSI